MRTSEKLRHIFLSREFLYSFLLFAVLTLGIVINPLWKVPTYDTNRQLLTLILWLACSLALSVILYFCLTKKAHIDNAEHTETFHEESKHKEETKHKEPWWKDFYNWAFILVCLVFLVINYPHIFDSLQNCGDEGEYMRFSLLLMPVIKELFNWHDILGILTTLATAVLCLSLVSSMIASYKKLLRIKKISLISSAVSFLLLLAIISISYISKSVFSTIIREDVFSWMIYTPYNLIIRVSSLLLSAQHPDVIMRAIALIFSTGTLIIIYQFFKKNYSKKTGLMTATFYAFSALFLISATSLYVTNIYLFFGIWACLMFVKFLKTYDNHYLALATILSVASFMFKIEGAILSAFFIIVYILRLIDIDVKHKRFQLNKAILSGFVRNILIMVIIIVPYFMFKIVKKNINERDLIINQKAIMGLFDPNLIAVYPKTIVEQFTIPITILFVIGLLYLWLRYRDEFTELAIVATVITIILATLDGAFFIGADYGRFIAGVGIFVAGVAAIFLGDIISRLVDRLDISTQLSRVIALSIICILAGYMLFNMYNPLSFEKMKYDPKLAYTFKHRPFEQNSRFLPTRTFAEKMKATNINNTRILYLTEFPHPIYDKLVGLNNTFIMFRDKYFSLPYEQQNAQTLQEYILSNNISYIIIPYINSTTMMEWWYSCAFAPLEVGDNPTFLPKILEEQKEFKIVLYAENRNGGLYLVRAG